MTDLPTIEFTTSAGVQRRIRYERADDSHRVERHVDRWDSAESEWVPVGAETLAEIYVDGECRSAVTILEGS